MIVEAIREFTDEDCDYAEKYLRQIDRCGRTSFISGKFIVHRCKKRMCKKCGGDNKTIHKNNYKAVMDRLGNTHTRYIRQMVFTVPYHLRREHFMTKKRLNQLFGVVQRLIKREFGVMTREKVKKNGMEKIYSLNKRAVAFLHLFGRGGHFNPHINVLIFEDSIRGNRLNIGKEKLNKIKKTYWRALQALLRVHIDDVVFHYSYRYMSRDVKKSIWYMAKPMRPDIPELYIGRLGDMSISDLIMYELSGFHYIRFWGQLANSEYKKVLEAA